MKGDFAAAEKTFRRVVVVGITDDEVTNDTDDVADTAVVIALQTMLQFADMLYVKGFCVDTGAPV